jgi:hypothetical protein
MAKSLVAWIAGDQFDLLREVVAESGLELAAIGSTTIDDAQQLAASLGTHVAGDLRDMLASSGDAVAWIAEPGAYDPSLCPLIRSRTQPTITSTPLAGTLEELGQAVLDEPAARFVPLTRRAAAFGPALDEPGSVTALAATLCCDKGQGGLAGRLFDGMDFLLAVLGQPQEVHAIYGGARVPASMSDLRGHMHVMVRFEHRRSGALLLSDTGPWFRIASASTAEDTFTMQDQATEASLIAAALRSEVLTPVPDAAGVHALCEAARLSCLTGSPENPQHIAEMLRY